jgi:hypothetical protein
MYVRVALDRISRPSKGGTAHVTVALNGRFELCYNDTQVIQKHMFVTDCRFNRGDWTTDDCKFVFNCTKGAVMSS